MSISRVAAKTTLALAVAALTIGIAQADLGSARDALAAGNYSDAITDLDQVLEKSPKNEEARFLKGLAFARSGDTDSALKVFNALVEDQPDMAEAWNNLGVLRARDGDLTGARDALQQATRIDPQHGPAQENLGDIYVALARNAYSRAGELESDNALARAKSQQLAAFIGSGQGSDQGSDQGNAQGGAQTASAQASSGASTPPPVPNVTRGAQGQAMVDTSTPQAALQTWSQAWSDQDVGAYLAMYSDAFVPDDGASRSAWAAQRRQRVSAPSRIEVTISDVQVTRRGEQALLRFSQRYRSNTYQDREHKALLMGEGADGWQILREGSADDIDFTVAAQPQASAPAAASTEQAGQPSSSLDDAASDSTADNATPAGLRSAPAELQAASETQAARQAVRDALQGWAQAWSNQNMQAYMNAYSDNYRPREGESRTDWVRERKSALKSPNWIRIDLSDVQISLLGDDRAQASFNQHYQSDSHEDRERKRVTLIHEDGGWRIVRES
ncbi:L,D-transpeptidase Cds6 family protein [Salinisphaera aquimarina]|uniref:Tetratricopeptide repeat protein n=1 Tax=Salinisphaera aquimarina TaxID=2094031 RepID=A0ABV7EUQ5_9GAMM